MGGGDKLDTRNPLVWIDCEMTGLDIDNDEIIEIFCLVTNGDLELLDEEGWGAVIHLEKERMDKMDEWCTTHHASSGLTSRVLSSTTTPSQASSSLLTYIQSLIPIPKTALLAGNSVHADQAFLRKEPYKKILDHLHYRILDVSSIKEAAKRWCGEDSAVLKEVPKKSEKHRAREDILESIEEARYYRDVVFKRKDGGEEKRNGGELLRGTVEMKV